MHLPNVFRGLGSPNQLAVEMPDQTIRLFYGITQDLGAALAAGGRPQRPFNFGAYSLQGPQWGIAPNGYYNVTQFMGGYLLDGCPLNVIFGQGWQAGQQQALQAAGITCSAGAMIPAVQTQSTMIAPIPTVTGGTGPQGSVFTPTGGTSVLIAAPGTGSAAPVTAGGGGGGPIQPVQYDPGMSSQPGYGGGTDTGTGLPDWLPYAAAGVVVLLLLSRRKGA